MQEFQDLIIHGNIILLYIGLANIFLSFYILSHLRHNAKIASSHFEKLNSELYEIQRSQRQLESQMITLLDRENKFDYN